MVEIEIRNFEKYMARKDIKNPWWFKLSNAILEDPDIFDLTPEEFKAYIYVLCQASKKMNKKVTIIYEHCTRVANVRQDSLNSMISKLSKRHIFSRIRTRSVRDPYMTRTDHGPRQEERRREEKREEENKTLADFDKSAVKFDFEKIYQQYPRKEGKSRGMKICANQIKTEIDYEKFTKAVSNYTEHCKRTKTDIKYIKHFSTFMSEWRDWVSWSEVQCSTKGRSIEDLLAIERQKEALRGNDSISGAVI